MCSSRNYPFPSIVRLKSGITRSKSWFICLNLRVVGGAFLFISSSFDALSESSNFTNVLALKRAVVMIRRPSNSGELNEVWEYINSRCVTTWNPVMQILACRKFDIFHRVEQHDSCHFSSETHLTKYLIRGFHTTSNRVLCLSQFPVNYK